jgi:hypothetical protein
MRNGGPFSGQRKNEVLLLLHWKVVWIKKHSPPMPPPIAQAIDRSVNGAMNQMDVAAYYKMLPTQTQQYFHQDAESGAVLWYPAPPFLAPTEARMQRKWNQGETMPVHSLDYLYHMATQAERGGK